MIDLIIDLPEECKTAEEILTAMYEKRHDLIEADVYYPDRFTMRITNEQFDALKAFRVNIFHYQSSMDDAKPAIAGFIVEVRK